MKTINKTVKHIDTEHLASFLDRTISSADREIVIEHLIECKDCRAIVVDSAQSKHQTITKNRRTLSIRVLVPIAIAASIAFVTVIPLSDTINTSQYTKSIVLKESWIVSAKKWIEQQIKQILHKDDR